MDADPGSFESEVVELDGMMDLAPQVVNKDENNDTLHSLIVYSFDQKFNLPSLVFPHMGSKTLSSDHF